MEVAAAQDTEHTMDAAMQHEGAEEEMEVREIMMLSSLSLSRALCESSFYKRTELTLEYHVFP